MEVADEFYTYEGRLASFQASHKKRASNANGSRTTKTIRWPHAYLKPEAVRLNSLCGMAWKKTNSRSSQKPVGTTRRTRTILTRLFASCAIRGSMDGKRETTHSSSTSNTRQSAAGQYWLPWKPKWTSMARRTPRAQRW
jgi:hypothetical protein